MEKAAAKAKFKEADRLFRAGWFDDALLVLNELELAFPDNRNILFPMARCLAELGRHDEALAVCDSLIDLWDYDRAARLKRRILRNLETAPAGGNGQQAGGGLDDLGELPPFSGYGSSPSEVDQANIQTRRLSTAGEATAGEEVFDGLSSFDLDQPSTVTRTIRRISAIGPGALPIFLASAAVIGVAVTIFVASPPGTLSAIAGAMGVLGWIAAALLAWGAQTGAAYAVLGLTDRLPFDHAVDNVLDIAIVTFVATLIMIVPFIGYVLALALVKHRYQLAWPQFWVFAAVDTAAISLLGVGAWIIWGGPTVV